MSVYKSCVHLIANIITSIRPDSPQGHTPGPLSSSKGRVVYLFAMSQKERIDQRGLWSVALFKCHTDPRRSPNLAPANIR